jgi:hypothetical protein
MAAVMFADPLRNACPSFLRPAARRMRAKLLPGRTRSSAFARIYRAGGWRGPQPTASGSGSDLDQTARVRAALPGLVADLNVTTLVDAPCGDFYWMQECDLAVDMYIGIDIVPELVETNSLRYGRPGRGFQVCDLVNGAIPHSDLILCRDCFVHLTSDEVRAAVRNFQRSASTYLLTTTFCDLQVNDDLDQPGGWRPLNLEVAPFNFPPPLRLINEGCSEFDGRYPDKSLGLWRLADLAP